METSLEDDCPDTKCGLNGIWLGRGVPFRTLHLTPGRANERSLAILYAKGTNAEGESDRLLTINITNDVLRGTPAGGTEIPALKGWRLFLGKSTACGPQVEYILKIEDITSTDFWAQRTGLSQTFPKYKFSAKRMSDGCDLKVCKPGISNNNGFPNIDGTAVIFRGDYYNDDNYTVSSSPTNSTDNDVFNIACLGTTISKLHLLRHTSASNNPATAPPTQERTTMLKLISADYCGDGKTRSTMDGHPFTIDGTTIKFGFDNSLSNLQLTAASGYTLTFPVNPIEALWSRDGGGATCIGTPRLPGLDVSAIQQACANVGHNLLPCPTSADKSFDTYNYATSAP